MKLSADNVTAVFNRCLSEAGGTHVQADGVVTQAEFDPARLNEALPEIESMLDQLSDDFKEEGGGGMSFLRMCDDKHDHQWTGFHATVDMLVCLGLATGRLNYLLPRELWKALPGGVPYLVIPKKK